MTTPSIGKQPVEKERGYINIQDHGLIGNMHTAALVSIDGSIESYCVPDFDSPSIFARILDKDKGGHFSITPHGQFNTKQSYLPSSNVLSTKFLSEEGVANVIDFLPRQSDRTLGKAPLFWLIRRVEIIRGKIPLRVEVAPAFNYARSAHSTTIIDDNSTPDLPQKKILFNSPPDPKNKWQGSSLDLRYVVDSAVEGVPPPKIDLQLLDLRNKGHLGLSAFVELGDLVEGQVVTFVLRTPPDCKYANGTSTNSEGSGEEGEACGNERIVSKRRATELGVDFNDLVRGTSKLRRKDDPILTAELVSTLLRDTNTFWNTWIRKSTYKGSWKEAVHRSALALKLLIFEPTGAIVASPTFSLPEYIGGTRNWDYRASWIRDSSFTLYALIRLGFTQEANAYMDFIFHRLEHRNADGSLQIMYTIRGGKDLEEIELNHLDGHKGSRPVRIGNGAADHLQLDIYGELMDCIYLGQKFGKPLSYEIWVAIRELVEYVVANHNRPDLSIWEVRNRERNFTYSKVMMWVAIDRGLRLADKRSLPCPRRDVWLAARDHLYEEIMTKAWNPEKQFFGQSYEDTDVLDSAVLIMPLVFFSSNADNRFLSTLKAILKSRERGGLTVNNLVYRYDVTKTDDGVGGEEGTFCLCTLWCVEALTRAGQYEPAMLQRAVTMFEDFLQYGNHVSLFSEEISDSGEGLGNAVQGFTHVTLISAAYNLSRTMAGGPVGRM